MKGKKCLSFRTWSWPVCCRTLRLLVISYDLAIPVVQFTLNGMVQQLCLRQEENIDLNGLNLLKISTAAIVLTFTFTVLISIRANKNLKKLEDQHLKNLPANNALTFVDTLILCFLSYSNFFLLSRCSILIFSHWRCSLSGLIFLNFSCLIS